MLRSRISVFTEMRNPESILLFWQHTVSNLAVIARFLFNHLTSNLEAKCEKQTLYYQF